MTARGSEAPTPGQPRRPRAAAQGAAARRAAALAIGVLLTGGLLACGDGGDQAGAPLPDATDGTTPDVSLPAPPGFPGFDAGALPDAQDPGPDPDSDAEEPAPSPDADVSSPPLPCTPEGKSCNDGDPCTFNDACQADGECRGTPLDCDDDVPCTINQCVGGTCTTGIAPGQCYIDGVCWSDGQPNPLDPLCRKCSVPQSIDKWTVNQNFACNDGDACTTGDVCTPQGCQGTPVDCDDGEPCTQDACDPAVGCTHTPLSGPCEVAGAGSCRSGACQAGACQAKDAPNGTPCDAGDPCTMNDACQAGQCVAGPPLDADGDGYVAEQCGGDDCDDDDPNVNPGAIEICDDGIDNDCDGLVDGDDPDCCGGASCTFHTDCYPEKFCADWPPSCGLRCSTPCAGPLDCPSGEICVHLPGSAGYGYCRASRYPQAKPSGASCGGSAECRSEICVGICGDYCARQSACPTGTCSPAGDLQGVFFGVCAPGSTIGPLPLGAQCQGQPDCASGHCDMLSSFRTCSPLCKSDGDCLLSQECNLVFPAGGNAPGTLGGKPPSANAVPFDPAYPNKTFDMGLACYMRQYPQATGGIGSPCTHPSQCRSNKCFGLDPAQPAQAWCTSYCTRDSDCPSNMACKQDVVTLVSHWLNHYGGFNPQVGTFVRTCKWK